VNRRILLLGAAGGALAACTRRRPVVPVEPPRFVVGPAWRAGQVWFYPAENYGYVATGLAVVQDNKSGSTATREVWDGTALLAAHQTLQLPCILRVTNLETGLQILVRAIDRGPDSPGRVVALSTGAGRLLGVTGQGVARVRVEIDPELSRQAVTGLAGQATLQVAAAPRDSVRADALPPPPGIRQSLRGRSAASNPVGASVLRDTPDSGPVVLPTEAKRVPADPGRIWLQAGEFGRIADAERLRARLAGGTIGQERRGRQDTFRVGAGPYATVSEADAALDHALRSGVTDARLVVETR